MGMAPVHMDKCATVCHSLIARKIVCMRPIALSGAFFLEVFAVKKGVLVYDQKNDRMEIRFGLDDYYGGLHCGTTMDVLIGRRWVPTRIELSDRWYLVGIKTSNIEGLIVRL